MRANLLPVLILVLGTILFGCTMGGRGTKLVSVEILGIDAPGYYENISPKQVKEIMDIEEEFVLIDVRTSREYNDGHIKGSKHLPITKIEQWHKGFDRNAKIILYCQGAVRSAKASKILVEKGFKSVYNMEGGIVTWRYDIVK